jgi:hypothetical protein
LQAQFQLIAASVLYSIVTFNPTKPFLLLNQKIKSIAIRSCSSHAKPVALPIA